LPRAVRAPLAAFLRGPCNSLTTTTRRCARTDDDDEQALRSCGVNGFVEQAGRCVCVCACVRARVQCWSAGSCCMHVGGVRGVCVRAAGMACCLCMPCALSRSCVSQGLC
jgi:hypothetical protein